MVQFDAVTPKSPPELKEVFNAALPADITVLDVNVVDRKFSAMDNLWKRYVYTMRDEDCPRVLSHGPVPKDVGEGETLVMTSDGVSNMQKAANYLVGSHDFAGFQSKGGRTSTTRMLYKVKVSREEEVTKVVMEGEGFLYNMCRIIAGTLLQVGHGLRTAESVEEALESLDRARCGPTLPPQGLCLEHVEYETPWTPEATTDEKSDS